MSAAVYTPPLPFTRDANAAGLPLPSIPRRTSSTTPRARQASSAPSILLAQAGPSSVVLQPPTPPHPPPLSPPAAALPITARPRADSSASASTSSSADTPRPLSHRRHGDDLRLDLDAIAPSPSPRRLSAPALAASVSLDAAQPLMQQPPAAATPTTKAGTPLKSSLKSRRPSEARPTALQVLAGYDSLRTKSEPVTPTAAAKNVHFDDRLERVRHFLSGQKPSAVSRDGSPRETTDEEDSDWPRFIYGPGPPLPTEKDAGKRVLRMRVEDGHAPAGVGQRMGDDVVLEEIKFVNTPEGARVEGIVRVRNVAFEKRVAVRFTFDNWTTTSEVAGRYLVSAPDHSWDRFGFEIRVPVHRAEEKVLVMAVSYHSGGREMWDSNAGKNYRARFELVKEQEKRASYRPQQQRSRSAHPGASFATSISDEEMSDLTSKLEKVAAGGNAARAANDDEPESPRKEAKAADAFEFEKGESLSKRYDFAASSRMAWHRPASPASVARMVSPTREDGAVPWPRQQQQQRGTPRRSAREIFQLGRGSPREPDEEDWRRVVADAARDEVDEGELPFARPAPAKQRGRIHQRGYFDLGFDLGRAGSGFRPYGAHHTISDDKKGGGGSGTPRLGPDGYAARLNSYPPVASPPHETGTRETSLWGKSGPAPAAWHAALAMRRPLHHQQHRAGAGVGSEASTPSFTTGGSSSSEQTSPEYERENPLSPVGGPDYTALVNQLCFFTGGNSPGKGFLTPSELPGDELVRSHSASSVQDYFGSPASSVPPLFASSSFEVQRSSSFDDATGVGRRSGSSTPRVSPVA
ncbi:hypothetical protein PUNSTDRAFT_53293 [Punctularia strigosozonata HHB-11173 SS5]|uniref:uncharacterized protein n=1 Tax=Punctularia strigosozonata (strain HHB-11173) TaxID=741275 RepID=UPI0004416590|nr:uncharacterized protein PUNSTDRAFT_53293 [Punctularia strigosozonata HHB-11173 SS5]EIN07983.1 hypothetical protein PUNSTDRAFT_53293 [Punctularia strigosozonata HHB-11173 SS5]